ncbi:MAG: Tfp pilus assembly protein FimT/FimU [Alphaproteobacteria bacterium]
MHIFKVLKQKIKIFETLKNNTFPAMTESGMNGRTMVEMLGVLAIVGILSIGGVAGYNYGIDKYRANTIVNEINMRAVDLMLQSARGLELNLDEWDNTSMVGYTFDQIGRENGSIYLQVSGLPKRVCDMVVDILNDRFELHVVATREAGDTTLCGDDNSIRIYFEETGDVPCESPCPANAVCVNGICMNNETQPVIDGEGGAACSTDADCPECWACSTDTHTCSNFQADNTPCKNNTGTCQKGLCYLSECTGENACGTHEFCAHTYSDSYETDCHTQANKCVSLNNYFIRTTITLDNNSTEVWFVSNTKSDWYNAKAACEAAGLTMIRMSDVVKGWNGSEGLFIPEERAQKLAAAIGTDGIWTADGTEGVCHQAFVVGLNYAYVTHYEHHYTFPFICRQ